MNLLFDFTILHVLISLIALVSGVALAAAFAKGDDPRVTRLTFLWSTAANLLTGFLFPFHEVTPAIVVGVINTAILIGTIVAYRKGGSGRFWPVTYKIGALTLLYFNCLVLIAQSFQKVPVLHSVAPIGNELPVVVSQGVLFVVALLVGYAGLRGPKRQFS